VRKWDVYYTTEIISKESASTNAAPSIQPLLTRLTSSIAPLRIEPESSASAFGRSSLAISAVGRLILGIASLTSGCPASMSVGSSSASYARSGINRRYFLGAPSSGLASSFSSWPSSASILIACLNFIPVNAPSEISLGVRSDIPSASNR
jgi:hypothetical protein